MTAQTLPPVGRPAADPSPDRNVRSPGAVGNQDRPEDPLGSRALRHRLDLVSIPAARARRPLDGLDGLDGYSMRTWVVAWCSSTSLVRSRTVSFHSPGMGTRTFAAQ
jgi:hypothetical protein